MIIINSAAYISYEFQNDLGMFPPCLLPVGNRRLVEFQVRALRHVFPGQSIIVTLPKSYQPTEEELSLFSILSVMAIPLPDGLSLGEAVSRAIDAVWADMPPGDCIKLLHGDTLIHDLPSDADVIAVTNHTDGYSWEYLDSVDNASAIWAGFFSFSDIPYMKKSLYKSDYSFNKAVTAYAAGRNAGFGTVKRWNDFGHLDTYFLSRSRITTERAFNRLRVKGNICYKSSARTNGEREGNQRKLRAEAHWFQSLPLEMKRYCPNYLGAFIEDNSFVYATEFLPVLPLSEIFVHGKNSVPFWKKIFTLIAAYLTDAKSMRMTQTEKVVDDAKALYDTKTRSRLKQYLKIHSLNMKSIVLKQNNSTTYTIGDIMEICISRALEQKTVPGILHGDLCFSNILFDSRANIIKLIDPRGMNFNNEMTIYGDINYDVAKLTHSVIGMYDYIVAKKYKIMRDSYGYKQINFNIDNRMMSIQDSFKSICLMDDYNFSNIIHSTILLFLSMLPLHNDDKERQEAFLLNAVRLFRDYILV